MRRFIVVVECEPSTKRAPIIYARKVELVIECRSEHIARTAAGEWLERLDDIECSAMNVIELKKGGDDK